MSATFNHLKFYRQHLQCHLRLFQKCGVKMWGVEVHRVRTLFLRCVCLTYAVAFHSLYTQVSTVSMSVFAHPASFSCLASMVTMVCCLRELPSLDIPLFPFLPPSSPRQPSFGFSPTQAFPPPPPWISSASLAQALAWPVPSSHPWPLPSPSSSFTFPTYLCSLSEAHSCTFSGTSCFLKQEHWPS